MAIARLTQARSGDASRLADVRERTISYIETRWPSMSTTPFDVPHTGLWTAAYEEGSDRMIWLNVHPVLDPLRSDPRFEDLMGRMGAPARATSAK